MSLIDKYLTEGKKPPKGTLYIENSSIFDSGVNKYDIKGFMKVLKKAGAKKVWKDNTYGWSNQPEVVLFTGLDKKTAEDAINNAYKNIGKWGIMISDASLHWE